MKDKTKRIRKTRIMVFGTFDGVHKGHENFFRQAKKIVKKPLKSFLIVSVARDRNVLRIKKQSSILNEKKRLALIKKYKIVDKVVLSGLDKHIPHIAKEKPDIIALGYDQRDYVKNLKKDLKNKGILVKIVRLKPYKENIYKNYLLKIKR